jgi:diguanylate cyclase (GGDEF)-like protein
MVVNRVDAVKAPYKILSCPVVSRAGTTVGLIALFRGASSVNFELDDVRVIEFLSRQAMVLLSERQDPVTGLMIGSAFERLLDARLGTSVAPTGTLLYVDINRLKDINQSFGLHAGDEAILRTAQLIRRALTAGEIGCRLSADRFVAYLPERDFDSATMLGTEIAKSAEALGYTAGGKRSALSVRFGVAEPPKQCGASRHWIAVAERSCQESSQR